MLQRIQTIYLLLIICISFSLLFLKIPAFDIDVENCANTVIYFNSTLMACNAEIITSIQNYYSIALISVLIVFTIIILFMFKKIELQSKLTRINFIIIALIYLSLYFDLKNQNIIIDIERELKYKWGIIFPVILLLLNYLALKGILKDKQRLKSSRSIR